MELALFLISANIILIGMVILLRYNQLIGLLTTIYCSVWGVTIFLFAIFSFPSIAFMTFKGISIIYGHFLCIIFSSVFTFSSVNSLLPFNRIAISSKSLFLGCLLLSSVGIIMILYTTDFVSFYVQNQLAQMRGELFEQKIVVNRYFKFIGNFVYPLAIVAPLYFMKRNRNPLVLGAVVLLGAMLSVSNGGKGNLLIVVIILIGAITYLVSERKYQFPKVLKRLSIVLAFAMVLFFYFISVSRVEDNSTFSALDNIVLINQYFSSSIPSFCQWVEHNRIGLFNFDIGQLAIFREMGAIIGLASPRVIDQQIVNIPHPFNVFTAFADSLSAFGYFGSLIYYLFIGAIFGAVDVNSKNDNNIFLFSTLFLFIGYSLFTDVFFYMIGTWICLSFHFLFVVDKELELQ